MNTSNDPRSPGQRIADDLRERIASGHLPPGGKVPANRDLAEQYGVTRVTARRAVSLLIAEGLIVTRHGSGAYVRVPHPIRRLGPDRYARRRWQVTTVEAFADERQDSDKTEQQGSQTQTVALVQADSETSAALDTEPDSPVYERARVVTRDGTPTHTMTSYYRPQDVEGTPLTDSRPGLAGRSGGFQVLSDQGLVPHQITEEVFARMPTADEAETLNLPPGEPVVEVRRTTRTAEGQAIEYAKGIHTASRFVWSFTYDIPD